MSNVNVNLNDKRHNEMLKSTTMSEVNVKVKGQRQMSTLALNVKYLDKSSMANIHVKN